MANNSGNLRIPSSEEARRNGQKGGKASAKRRAQLKAFKDVLKDGMTPMEQEAMMKRLRINAMRGNLPSLEFLLKMMGEHPDQINEGNDSVINIKVGVPDYKD